MKKFIPNLVEDTDSDGSSINELNPLPVAAMSDEENSDSISESSELSQSDGISSDLHDNSDACNLDSDSDNDSDIDSTSSEEPDVTMSEIFGVEVVEKEKVHPPDIKVDSAVVDVCFHPDLPIIATASMGGETVLYNYSLESCEERSRFTHHRKACRQVCFSEDGKTLFTVSKDKSLAVLDSETGDVKVHIKRAHDSPIYSFQPIKESLCATGDDDGVVKLWDLRTKESVMEFKCGEQTVASLISCDKSRYLAAGVADGSVAGFNIHNKKIESQSEFFDFEVTSLSLICSDTKLCVGTGSGKIYIFKWGQFGYNVDTFKGHSSLIQCQIALTDNIVLTGCEDGKIRAAHMYPHRFIGVVGRHEDFGVENLSISHDGTYLASCSMDDVVKFWNVEFLYDEEVNKMLKKDKVKKLANKGLESAKERLPPSFFADFKKGAPPDDEKGPIPSTVEENPDMFY